MRTQPKGPADSSGLLNAELSPEKLFGKSLWKVFGNKTASFAFHNEIGLLPMNLTFTTDELPAGLAIGPIGMAAGKFQVKTFR